MKLAKTLIAAPALSLIMLGNVGASDSPEGLVKIFGNFVDDTDPGNGIFHAGYEVAVPFFKITVASPTDTYPSSIAVTFKVYAAETGALIRTTPAKLLSQANGRIPALPAGCTASTANLDYALRFARREDGLKWTGAAAAFSAGSQRAHMAMNFTMFCYDGVNWQESKVGNIYSANLSGKTGAAGGGPIASWLRTYPGRDVAGINVVDHTGDLVNDMVMITTHFDVDAPAMGENFRVQFVNAGDGTDALPPRGYPFARINVAP